MPRTKTENDAADIQGAGTESGTVDIEALKAQIRAEVTAEMNAKKASEGRLDAQAERKARMTMAEAKKDLVDIELFQDDDKYKDDLYVAVNGERYQIKRGVRVSVPRFVADAIELSTAQDRATAKMITRYEQDYQKAAKDNIL
jgi:hypothetical protein